MDLENWEPKTKLGKMVKEGKITNIDDILSKGIRILEPEIVDYLLPNLKVEFILIGKSKGKYKRRRYVKMVQKKTAEGNKTRWVAMAVVGDEDGHVGVGLGKHVEITDARDKAIRNAKLNIIKIARGCGSWECACGKPHSIPFKVIGRTGYVRVHLLPAPRGVGLVASDEVKKVLRLAGIKDIWMRSFGQTTTKINHIYAVFEALKKLTEVKVNEEYKKLSGLVYGSIR